MNAKDDLDQRVERGRARLQLLLEVLRLTAAGVSTSEMARQLGVDCNQVAALQRTLDP